MDPAPGALVTVLLVAFAPGALLFRAIHPRARFLECLALAPSLSLTVTFLLGEVTTLTGLPFGPLGLLIAVGLLGVVATLRGQHRNPRMPQDKDRPERGSGVGVGTRHAAALLAAGIFLCGITWLVGLRGVGVTPPNRDAASHGLMAARVARLETMHTAEVLTSDALGNGEKRVEGTAFYPLALHGEVALAHRLAGIPVADGLLAVAVVFAAIVLPLGLFLLARSVAPQEPLVAGLAALLVGAVGFFPFLPMEWGGIALIAGVALVPAGTVVVARFLLHGGGWAEASTAALVVVGIFATHSSEVPLLVLIAGSILAAAVLRSGGWQPLLAATRRALALGAVFVALLLPVLGSVTGGAAERSGIGVDENLFHTPASALVAIGRLVSFPRRLDALALLALIGAALCLWRRRHLALVGAAACLVALSVVAATVEGPLRVITLPWYHQAGRIAYNLVILVPVFAALALAAGASHLGRLLARGSATARLGVPAVTAIAVLLGVMASSVHAPVIRSIFQKHALTDSDAVAAFFYLNSSLRTGERVLNDVNNDGGLWMYAFTNVPPVFGLEPARPDRSWRERLWLLDHLPDHGSDPRVAKLVEKYRVRFVYLNDRHFTDHPHRLSVEALGTRPGICERLRQGTSHVFEVVAGECS